MARAEGGHHQAVEAVVHRVQQLAAVAQREGDQRNPGRTPQPQRRGHRRVGRPEQQARLPLYHQPQRSRPRRGEGGDGGRVRLADVARGVDLVRQHRQHSQSTAAGVRSHRHCARQVRRAVRTRQIGAPHGPGHHDGRGGRAGEVEQEGGLLQGVRSLDHHHAGAVLGDVVDAVDQFAQVLERQRGTRKPAEVLDLRPDP